MGYRYKKKLYAIPTVIGASCDNCKVELKRVFVDYESSSLMTGALGITLSGGYDCFFDGNDVKLIFCEECAVKLAEAFPCFREAT